MRILSIVIVFVVISISATAQIPLRTLVDISKAEDELRFDETLRKLMTNPSPAVRERAALAAGRIGNDAAIGDLEKLVNSDKSDEVRTTAMFALGEIESIKAAEIVLGILADTRADGDLRARAIEAAGKIAAANAKEPKSAELGKAIVNALEFEIGRRSMSDRLSILLGLTAVLRARPEGGDAISAKFLDRTDPRIRADALNTMTRIRAKNANAAVRSLLESDNDGVVRANAARVLGAAEDKESIPQLLKSATGDADARVRVSAIRSLGSLKDASVAPRLIEYGETVFVKYNGSKFKNPAEKNELLEIVTTLGRLLQGKADEAAVGFINRFRAADAYVSPESETAVARIAPKEYVESLIAAPENSFGKDWRSSSAAFQALGEIAGLESNESNNALKLRTKLMLIQLLGGWLNADDKVRASDDVSLAIPDLLRAFAAFKSENTSNIIRPLLEIDNDPLVRAAAADILGDQPSTPENLAALNKALKFALSRDTVYNDAALSILDSLAKLDKKAAGETLILALGANDYLVRKKAFDLSRDAEIMKLNPVLKTAVDYATARGGRGVLRYRSGSKVGVVTNSDADYVRALSRRNGSVKAVLKTEKGSFTIVFNPEEAPLTVDNFIRLARAGYFNGLAVHRVVPNFVMQDGDNRGDGNGGPGWSIRCELNMLPYDRGAVGMALSGKDTGGSQWFVTHSPQPHLDGGYTVFGRVPESDMKVVDSIVRGDRILKVEILEARGRVKPIGFNRPLF